jgi:hypothetical protein
MRHLLLALVTAACGTESLEGSITSTVYGEDFIEQGIPADVFSDGWSVQFDQFLVSIGKPSTTGEREVGDAGFHIVDLAQPSSGEGYALATYDAPGGFYEHHGYQLRASATATGVNVGAGDVAAMKAGGYSMWVRGSATDGAQTKTFDWPLSLSLTYADCEMGQRIDGQDLTMQSTIHADHLFYDDAVSPEPAVAFQLIANADGADGSQPDDAITLAELAALDIRTQSRYQVGSQTAPDGSSITNLQQYVELQATTVGHLNGEGHCATVIVEK